MSFSIYFTRTLTHEFLICLTHAQYKMGYMAKVPIRAILECTLIRMSMMRINYYNYHIEMEEYSLEVRGEMQQIFKVLSKDQHDKMPFQGIEIAKSLARLPFFRRFFDTNSEHFINLCIAQDAVVLAKGTSVYKKQASDGYERYLYLVLQGKFQLSSADCNTRQLGIIRIFGQTEILFGLQNRKENVIALQQSKVMRIKESAILKIFNKRDDIKRCLHFTNINQYFSDLSELEKMQISLSMVRASFEKGTIIKSDGERLDQVLFFIYGKAEVVTRLLKNGKNKEFIIDFLQQLSTYGEYESTTGIGTPFRLQGTIAGAHYSLNYAEVKRQSHKIAAIIEENAIPYPNNEQLQFLEGVKSTLKKQEKRAIKHLYNR